MNKIYTGFRNILWLTATLSVVSCGTRTGSGVTTAQEFVTKYSEAYRKGNVRAIVKMTVLDTGETAASLKDEVALDIKSKGLGYIAWTHTRYVSEADHGSSIRVEVEIEDARSSIVLVKRDRVLKMVQDPSSYK
jgi:primosomal replication protein N